MIYKKNSYIDEYLPNFDKQSPCVCGKDQFNLKWDLIKYVTIVIFNSKNEIEHRDDKKTSFAKNSTHS